ncbi:MAG: aldo/keto reductase [Algoriphagus sp.]|nr:aldo/keto reductase [Algoriphagus sp.]
MERLKLPGTVIEISRIGLGGMSLKGDFKYDQSIISAALAGGVNFLDTADLYQKGLNEEILGAAIRGKRNEIVLATKVGNEMNPEGNGWSWNPRKEYILKAVEKSLKRLQTDYIDLYQLHGGTIEDPLEETFEAFEMLKTQGKIRAFGISSIRPNVIRKLMQIHPPATIMMQYSPLDRRPEETVFPLLEKSSTRVLVRGAFAKGLLIDKPEAGFLDFGPAQVRAIRVRIASFGFSQEAFLIRFGLAEQVVASLIIGGSSVDQVEKMVKGFEESLAIPLELIQTLKSEFPANQYDQHR